MEKKLKKQRKKLMIRISTILLAVWLILSCAYAAVAFLGEKERAYNRAHIALSDLTNMLEYPNGNMFAVDEARKIATFETHTYRNGKFSYTDVSYTYDDNVSVLVIDTESKYAIDFDDIINITFTAETEIPEYREPHFGYLSYKHFRASMTDEQYAKILSYLDNQPDGEYYYELLCTAFYQNDEGEVIPKTVQIVSTRAVHKWYVQDSEAETFDLHPEKTEGLTLYHISYLERNEIPEEFTRNTFSSHDLIQTAQQMIKDKPAEAGEEDFDTSGCMLREDVFSYIYYTSTPVTARVVEYASDLTPDDDPDMMFYIQDKDYEVYYAKRINVMDGCRRNILTAAGILFLFFLVIGVLLTVTMWRTLKMQIIEEQKRRDMTNALAHDIKTPLFVLSGYAGNLKENVQTDKREHYADVIVEQAEEVNRRVNRMLELSKLDSPNLKLNLKDFNLVELVAEILSNYEALPEGKTIGFAVDTPDGKCVITADRDLMKRAVENLVDNAVKYSDPDTAIKVNVTDRSFEIENACFAVNASDLISRTNPSVRFSHSRFGNISSGGSGLGLAIAKSISDLHHFKLICVADNGFITFKIII